MKNFFYHSFLLVLWLLGSSFFSLAPAQNSGPDILHYELSLSPNIQQASIKGELTICFTAAPDMTTIQLHAGNLSIDELSSYYVKGYRKEKSSLVIQLSEQLQGPQEIYIRYHGSPKRGLLFNPSQDQAHTVYFTDAWMPCHFEPADKATLSLNLVVPKEKQCIASGELQEIEEQGDKQLYKWKQDYETAPYTYGFAIGSFTEAKERYRDISLNYYASKLDETALKKVFEDTPAILRFFEEKSGIPYIQNSYSQVLIGNSYQEMSGLAVFNTSYPEFVFKDSSEIHLTAHELAHQWWGNMITCETFGHFWLNEAMAVYMASAFNEVRFGREKYEADIALYKGIYEDLLKRGKDHPLVFEKWNSTRDNRNIVYYKGAYFLHLLREEMGDDTFWKCIRFYSESYWGKTVTTDDFKDAMEEISGLDLEGFFKEWVY